VTEGRTLITNPTDISDLAIVARSMDAENALFAASESEGVLFAYSVLVLESFFEAQ
jgi:hypothetical protein